MTDPLSADLILPGTPAWYIDGSGGREPVATSFSICGEVAVGRDACAFAATVDGGEFDGFERYSRFYRYEGGRWSCVEARARITSMMLYREPGWSKDGLAVLTYEGRFYVLGAHNFETRVNGEDANVLSELRMLDGQLYVTGYGGQVYRRVGGEWRHDDAGMLDTPPPVPRPRPGDHGRASFSIDDLMLTSDGRDFYACGSAYIARPSLFWRPFGKDWRWLGLDPGKPAFDYMWLKRMYAETPETIWISTDQGYLLKGNGHDGFGIATETKRDHNDNLVDFTNMVRYGEHLYVGGSAVCRLLPDGRLEHQIGPPRVRMGQPEDVTTLIEGVLGIADGVLWAIGYGVLSRFDGQRWERILMPSVFG